MGYNGRDMLDRVSSGLSHTSGYIFISWNNKIILLSLQKYVNLRSESLYPFIKITTTKLWALQIVEMEVLNIPSDCLKVIASHKYIY